MTETIDDAEVLDVGAFYEMLTERLESAYGRRHPRWIRGEIAKVYEKSHLYVDLVDAGSSASDTKRPVLNAHCWASQWSTIKHQLAQDGVTLGAGAVVNLFGYVDLYAPSGRIGFTVTRVDVAGLLGDVARRRLELIARLRTEGLLEANRARTLSPVPLRVGLVASPGTEGFNDFTGQLLASRLSFAVTLVASAVQGEAAPAQIVRALATLDAAGLDVICVVRGGGSRGDLACFDDERVARAIATAATPVVTGIGHTGDESVADWRARLVTHASRSVADAAAAVLDEATEYVAERRRTMIFAVRDRLRAEGRNLAATRRRLEVSSRHVLGAATASLASARQLLGAYDPGRRLAQGWSIVTRRDGTLVRALADVAGGDELEVRVRDGSFAATVNDMRGGST